MIKAVIFDYFGVICTNWYWKQIKHHEKVQTTFPELANKVNIGELNWQQFLEEISQKTGYSVAELQKMYESEMIQPEVLAYARELHKKLKTAILTNAHHDFIDPAISGAHLYEVFDVIVISSLTGVLKPTPQSFERVVQRLGVSANEVVFVDDNPDNAEAATKLGIHPIVYKDVAQMKRDLETILSNENHVSSLTDPNH